MFELRNRDASITGHPLASLPREDLDLVLELVLKSGSLKDLAAAYGVSYPTIRSRLDKVIERLKTAVEGKPRDPVSEMLASMVERGEMTASGARAIRDMVRSQVATAVAAAKGGGAP